MKQLQKYDINVVTTSDGSEAIKEWEKRPIGYFHFALFDHRTYPLLSLVYYPIIDLIAAYA